MWWIHEPVTTTTYYEQVLQRNAKLKRNEEELVNHWNARRQHKCGRPRSTWRLRNLKFGGGTLLVKFVGSMEERVLLCRKSGIISKLLN